MRETTVVRVKDLCGAAASASTGSKLGHHQSPLAGVWVSNVWARSNPDRTEPVQNITDQPTGTGIGTSGVPLGLAPRGDGGMVLRKEKAQRKFTSVLSPPVM